MTWLPRGSEVACQLLSGQSPLPFLKVYFAATEFTELRRAAGVPQAAFWWGLC